MPLVGFAARATLTPKLLGLRHRTQSTLTGRTSRCRLNLLGRMNNLPTVLFQTSRRHAHLIGEPMQLSQHTSQSIRLLSTHRNSHEHANRRPPPRLLCPRNRLRRPPQLLPQLQLSRRRLQQRKLWHRTFIADRGQAPELDATGLRPGRSRVGIVPRPVSPASARHSSHQARGEVASGVVGNILGAPDLSETSPAVI